MLLSDIYGPRRLLETGDLPPEIVLANPAFIRAPTSCSLPTASTCISARSTSRDRPMAVGGSSAIEPTRRPGRVMLWKIGL